MHQRFCGSIVLLCIATIAGCATPGAGQLPEVEQSEPAPPPIERTTSEENQHRTAPADPSAATSTLLAAANAASADDDHAAAIVHVERAVRIDPRNPLLWIRLSQLHAAQGELDRARAHARKAIALAATDPAATRQAWLNMADIEEAAGNERQAKSIRQRYRGITG